MPEIANQEEDSSNTFIPSETMFNHLQLVCQNLKIVSEDETDAFKTAYVILCHSERSGYCANLFLNGKLLEMIEGFSPFLIVCIATSSIIRDMMKCNIDDDRMLFRQIEDNPTMLDITVSGLRKNMDTFLQKAKQVNEAILEKCDFLINKYKDDPKYKMITTTAEYTKASAYRNLGDAYRYSVEFDLQNEKIKATTQRYYDLSLVLAKKFMPLNINLQYLNTQLNAAVFKFDLCNKRQEAFDELLEVFKKAKDILFPLISENNSGQKSKYVDENFHSIQVMSQVIETDLREWANNHGFLFDASEILYTPDTQDEDNNEDDDTWLENSLRESQDKNDEKHEKEQPMKALDEGVSKTLNINKGASSQSEKVGPEASLDVKNIRI